MGIVHNPNNWHWLDKNCLPWSKTYLEEKLGNTEFKNDKFQVILTKVSSVTGDCDVTQRKGQTRCIFDLQLEFESKLSFLEEEDEDINFTILLPEFGHDQDEDDYDFIITGGNAELKKIIRDNFIPLVRAKLLQFQGDLIKEHDQSVKHNTD
ncbi:hypothetical protein PACTADRAFT_39340 [Pachysolen tannophilus NRRL Y-2460]|uniref:Activator of Hsp90 ATPase AHSA1-like N-terminal domain-containing protein n=1 Tax=Pachysolen tannophilus NRRL Y-2460 TaxID=669874 RepID=A0A1E4TZ96_PACTA|nr:hypothetical protein PACTADRAFT_39340 [Pachysolen tannophilus NRRL Y-2460]